MTTKKPLKSTHSGSIDGLDCYKLDDGTAVLTTQALSNALGFDNIGELIEFMRSPGMSPHVSPELMATLENPLEFQLPQEG